MRAEPTAASTKSPDELGQELAGLLAKKAEERGSLLAALDDNSDGVINEGDVNRTASWIKNQQGGRE